MIEVIGGQMTGGSSSSAPIMRFGAACAEATRMRASSSGQNAAPASPPRTARRDASSMLLLRCARARQFRPRKQSVDNTPTGRLRKAWDAWRVRGDAEKAATFACAGDARHIDGEDRMPAAHI